MPFAGTVAALLVAEGDTVEVGTPIITVDDGVGGAAAPAARRERRPSRRPAEPADPAGSSDTGGEEIGEGLIGGTTSTGRTAVLVGYGVKQTEAKRRPRKGAAAPASDAGPGVRRRRAARGRPRVGHPVGRSVPDTGARALAKPPVRKLAKDLGVDLAVAHPHGRRRCRHPRRRRGRRLRRVGRRRRTPGRPRRRPDPRAARPASRSRACGR